MYELNNDLYAQMSKGIESSKVVLVFVTKNYGDKVNGDNPMDNCKLEFDHSSTYILFYIACILNRRYISLGLSMS